MSTTPKIKVGAAVIAKGKPGRFVGTDDRGPGKGQGTWLKINFAEKGKPADVRPVRPALVQLA